MACISLIPPVTNKSRAIAGNVLHSNMVVVSGICISAFTVHTKMALLLDVWLGLFTYSGFAPGEVRYADADKLQLALPFDEVAFLPEE
ncbi:TPA: hypothetical protein PGG59_003813 [Raoultella planticola]|nr:hypothetical protein [Raoultella planticola]